MIYDLLIGALLVVVMILAVRTMRSGRMSRRTKLLNLVTWVAIGLVLLASLGDIDEQRAEGGAVRIRKSPDGHFWANVKLNGYERRMLIDSGATVIALSTATAKAAGITPDPDSPPVKIETANGTVDAASANLQHLEIGPLKDEDLEVTISDNLGEADLLGMNFLSRLKSWRVQGDELILEPDGATGAIEAAPEQRNPPPPPVKSRGGDKKVPTITVEKLPAEQE